MKSKSLLLAAAIATIVFAVTAGAATPVEEAQAALKANDLAHAEALLLPLTGKDATEAAAFFALGKLRDRQGNPKEAVVAYEQASKLDATKPEYFSALAIALSQRMSGMNFLQQGLYAGKMRKAFEKSIALDPHHIPGLIGLARYHVNAPEIAGGSTEKAVEYARRVRELAPFPGELELGNIANHEEKFADALAHLEAATKLNPNHGYAQFLCGQMLAKLGRKDEARARFETAVKLDPNLDAAKKSLAELDAEKR